MVWVCIVFIVAISSKTLEILYSRSSSVFWRSRQLLLNKFFDPSTPSMRKVDDEEKKEKVKIMSFIMATNVITSRPPKR